MLDPASLAYLSKSLPDIADPLTRGSAWVTLWDALLDGTLAPDGVHGPRRRRAAEGEPTSRLTARVLGYAGDAWWRFLPPAGTPERAAGVREAAARRPGASDDGEPEGGVVQHPANRGTDTADRGVASAGVGEDRDRCPACRSPKPTTRRWRWNWRSARCTGWKIVLDDAAGAHREPGPQGALPFRDAGALGRSGGARSWFQSLADVNNRRREPWVLEGLNYLHHPLRARASAGYVAPSLEMLWEIQKTGDIFFPKRWLDSTLGGYNSAEVAGIVRQFLAALPRSYPPRLKEITLQSADELFRSEAVLRK